MAISISQLQAEFTVATHKKVEIEFSGDGGATHGDKGRNNAESDAVKGNGSQFSFPNQDIDLHLTGSNILTVVAKVSKALLPDKVIGEGKTQISNDGQQQVQLTDPKTGASAGTVFFTIRQKQSAGGALAGAVGGHQHGHGTTDSGRTGQMHLGAHQPPTNREHGQGSTGYGQQGQMSDPNQGHQHGTGAGLGGNQGAQTTGGLGGLSNQGNTTGGGYGDDQARHTGGTMGGLSNQGHTQGGNTSGGMGGLSNQGQGQQTFGNQGNQGSDYGSTGSGQHGGQLQQAGMGQQGAQGGMGQQQGMGGMGQQQGGQLQGMGQQGAQGGMGQQQGMGQGNHEMHEKRSHNVSDHNESESYSRDAC